MASSISGTTKKRGRPKTTGKGTSINVRLQFRDLAALDASIDAHVEPKPSRPEAIRTLIVEGLTSHGFLKRADDHPKPVGPATDALVRMEGDIAKDRAKRKR